MDELGFLYTYSPVVSPEYNAGVENTIGIGKQAIKKRRLDMILLNKKEDLRPIILDCF